MIFFFPMLLVTERQCRAGNTRRDLRPACRVWDLCIQAKQRTFFLSCGQSSLTQREPLLTELFSLSLSLSLSLSVYPSLSVCPSLSPSLAPAYSSSFFSLGLLPPRDAMADGRNPTPTTGAAEEAETQSMFVVALDGSDGDTIWALDETQVGVLVSSFNSLVRSRTVLFTIRMRLPARLPTCLPACLPVCPSYDYKEETSREACMQSSCAVK